jgi:ATP-binding cassette, subfamily B, bacterial
VALVGENGAGKTTLVKLLCRLYEPSAGRILVDSVDLRRMAPEEWRARTSAAFQDFVRFELVVRESVGVGGLEELVRLSPAEADEVVRGALVRAGAEEVPAGLPSGLETQLGKTWEGGVDLSGGQWQKLALGRAFMREGQPSTRVNARPEGEKAQRAGPWAAGAQGVRERGGGPLLVAFDEPTAAIDAPTEHALFERFAAAARSGASRGTVTLIVSHRFSTVRMADLILVLQDGRIAEQGSHAELMAMGGAYAELYGLQARAYR